MRRRLWFLFLTLAIVVMCFTGCGKGTVAVVDNVINSTAQFLSGNVTGEVGKTYATDWFEFTIHSIDEVDSYAGYTPAEGNLLYNVLITEKGTFDEASPMGTFDFYMDDVSFDEYIWPMDPLNGSMMPESFDLEPGETVQYHMIFEIPSDVTDLMLMYTEIDETEKEGRTFTLHIDRP